MTDNLIDRLAADLKPVNPSQMLWLLALAATLGVTGSALTMIFTLHPRQHLFEVFTEPSFATKVTYTGILAVLGAWSTLRLARPGGSGLTPFKLAALALTAIGATALVSFLNTPPESRQAAVIGSSALVCPFYIAGLSLPMFAALTLFMRRMAPTDLSRAGFAVGLMAGAFGALVYSFHCPEPGLPFIAIWYSLGILAMTLIGTVTARLLLRW